MKKYSAELRIKHFKMESSYRCLVSNVKFKLIHYEMAYTEARINVLWSVKPSLKSDTRTCLGWFY